MSIFIGIDPGHRSGGACVIADNQEEGIIDVRWVKCPDKIPSQVVSFCQQLQQTANDLCVGAKPTVGLETVNGRRDDGGSRAFQFGRGYGMLEQQLHNTYPYELISPGTWQRQFDLYGMKDGKGCALSKTAKKNVHKEVAHERLKQFDVRGYDGRIRHWQTDAALIALYLHCAY